MSTRKFLNFFISFVVLVSMLLGGINLPVTAKIDSAPAKANPSMPMGPTDESKVPHYFGPYSNYANSAFTLAAATVSIDGDGSGATANATVGANGAVTDIVITNPGSGYTTAAITISGAGSGASADAIITSTGVVSSVVVDTPGAGYTAPSVVFTGPATSPATATAYGGVDSLVLDTIGEGYSMPTVDFDMPDDPNGTIAKAHVLCVELDCKAVAPATTVTITGLVIDNPGSGYAKAPNVVIRDGTIFNPLNDRLAAAAAKLRSGLSENNDIVPNMVDIQAIINATAHATISVDTVIVDTFGAGYATVPTVEITDTGTPTTLAMATAITDIGAITGYTNLVGGSGYVTTGGIQKFQDGLPMLCIPDFANGQTFADCTDNNLGQHIPIAIADTTTFPGADYYVIALVQHREQMHSDLAPTLLREYVQLETAENASWSKHVALQTDLIDGTTQNVLMPDGSQAVAVDDPHYLGPIIVANKDRPVRVVFYNLLPTGKEGDLFLPVDTTFMGSGMGPMDMTAPMDEGSVMDMVRNPMCGEADRTDMTRMDCFAESRATLHLHGGITPWISDGAPHQWITPANELTGWPQGVAVRDVPDMVGTSLPAGVPDCSADDDGCMTFYYTNQQSARLMFYHDHSWGITRLNVYAGEAAGYMITDETEQRLMAPGGPLADVGLGIPLIIQDRTYLPSPAQVAEQDPTWDTSRWGGEGNLWYEHVYMPAQNPADPSGMSSFGRWMYGPWFWPPVTPEFGPIANPYYNMDPATNFTTPLAVPCNLDDPTTWQYPSDPYCEPPQIPGTPNNSAGMEQFNDTPIVNGTAYPTVTLDPKSYRFRILNAANDRFWNLQWYVADPNTASTSLNANGELIGGTEVALNPAEVAAAQTDLNLVPNPLTSVIDNSTGLPVDLNGPDWIQIGTEGGFLPAPVVVDGQQVATYITDPTRFDVGNVDKHSMLLAPAERADVIVDFSKFAGQTLILYNDAPAAFPARVPAYDYYTGGPDQSPAGAPSTLPGYGPNTRTIMQVKIAAAVPAPAYNLTALRNAFSHKADGSGVFESGQNPVIVGQAGYNSAYGASFIAGGDCTNASGTNKCDGFARIHQQGGDTFRFDTLLGSQIGITIQPKALHDEMNSSNFEPFGRMSGNLGVEVVPADPVLQNVVLLPFVNPPTEIFDGTNLPTTDTITPISTMPDGTQIWKFTHNGVDTHPIHFHLYDVQLLNRVTWDNIIIPPDASELGWKDTVRVSPLEDTYFAIRPIIYVLPWEIPNSVRPLNPMMPIGDTTMFNPTDINGNNAPIVNSLVNFGWEYMMHCHILSHEEMDMMRPVLVAMPPLAPDNLTYNFIGSGNATRVMLTWNDNSITETAFVVQRSADSGLTWVDLTRMISPLDQPNTHRVGLTYTDMTYNPNNSYYYRVVAENSVGYGGSYPGLTVKSMTANLAVAGAPLTPPTGLSARVYPGPVVRLTWTDNTTNETGFVIMRSINGGAFTELATPGPRNGTGSVAYFDNTVVGGNMYAYMVAATNGSTTSAYSNTATVNLELPLAPSNLTATTIRRGNQERVILTWNDLATNETGYTVQWSDTAAFTTILSSTDMGANATRYITRNIDRQIWYFRIRAFNGIGQSAWVTTGAIAPAEVVTDSIPVNLIFMDDFTDNLAAWTGMVGNVALSPLAAMGDVEGQGLLATLGSVSDPVPADEDSPAYVYHQSLSLSSNLASFYFNPNGVLTGIEPVDIYTGLDENGDEVFGVQYQHTADAPTDYFVRAWALTETGEVYTDWAPIANAEQYLEVDWQSGLLSTLNLYVEDSVVAWVTADTDMDEVVEVRLGPSRGADETLSGTMYFDEFISLSSTDAMPFTIYMPVLVR